MNEYRVARSWQDARVTKIWAGTNEIMKELIGRDLGFWAARRRRRREESRRSARLVV
jgi:alkylation response protein AidB-like acyl-CoA dehydrogenase